MNKHIILVLLTSSNFAIAQQDEPYYPEYESTDSAYDSTYPEYNHYYPQYRDDSQYPYLPDQTNANNSSNQEMKSPPSQDAKEENAQKGKTSEGAPNPEKKSSSSKDVAKEEEKGENKEKKEEGDKEKKEDKKEEKAKSPHTFTSNVSLVSDYRFRGISQTMRRPAIQGGFDYSHESGIYLGTWASNVDGTTHFYNNTSMEWDLYGGYKWKPLPCYIPDLTYNLGLIYYYYPGGKTNARHSVRYNTGEMYLELTYKWLSIKYWVTLTDYFGINSHNPPFNWKKHHADRPNGGSRGSTNIEANVSFDLCKKICFGCLTGGKLNLFLDIGHQTVRNYEHLSCTHWRATLTQEFDWFNVFLSYVGTNARHPYFDVPDNAFHPSSRHLGAQGVVFGVIRTF